MSKFVVVQTQHPQVDQGGERAVGDEGEEVVVQVEHLHLHHVYKLLPGELNDQVVLEVESLESAQPGQASVGQTGDLASVQMNRRHPGSTKEHFRSKLTEVVAVEVEDGGVHGDLPGHVGEVLRRALDHVQGPRLVVVAGTRVRAFHSAVAGKECATPTRLILGLHWEANTRNKDKESLESKHKYLRRPAEGEAVLCVLAEEEGRGNLGEQS